ncbi:hypothetical protein JYU14_01290 [Simkania negevensis]|uniref:Transposase n=1 Tax=Simkania negevensis TaxID=83561 RepID=A0ABS3ARF5_9BACT|nr:hypothetical protein [Simkania negevensis]
MDENPYHLHPISRDTNSRPGQQGSGEERKKKEASEEEVLNSAIPKEDRYLPEATEKRSLSEVEGYGKALKRRILVRINQMKRLP